MIHITVAVGRFFEIIIWQMAQTAALLCAVILVLGVVGFAVASLVRRLVFRPPPE